MHLVVRLVPGASREAVGAVIGGELIVRVTAPPHEGQANAALIRLLAKRLRVGRRSVAITRGLHSRRKVVSVSGVTEAEAAVRLGGEAATGRTGRPRSPSGGRTQSSG